jgi:TRAP-type C4-dicarboxylate transport system substrate-binding protein
MKRIFAKALAAGGLAVMCLTAGASADTLTLKLAHVAPPTSSYQMAAESYAKHLRQLSGGTMDVDIVPGGALGNAPALWAQLRGGSLDMHLIDIGAVIINKEAKQFFITFAPYLYRSQDHWRNFLAGPTFKAMMADAESGVGFKYLGYLKDRPPRALTTRDTAVRTPADLQGLKVRTPLVPLITKTFEAWGASPTPIKASELYSALQTGLVDGQDNGIVDVVAAGYTEVQKYFMPINFVYSGIGVWMSGAKWQSLSKQQKAWALEAASLAFAEQKAVFDKEVSDAMAAAKAKGMTIVEPDLAAFEKAARPVVDGFDGKAWPAGFYDKIHNAD